MPWQTTPYSPLFVLSAGVSFTLALMFLRRRDRPGGRELSALFVALTGWALLSFAELSSVAVERKLAFASLSYGFVGLTTVAWFAFAAAFTDRLTFRTRTWFGLCAVPVAVSAAALSSPESGLLWTAVGTVAVDGTAYLTTSKGPVFWLHVLFSYGLVVAGSLLLGYLTLASRRVYRGQSLLLLGGLAVSWLTNVAYFLGLFPTNFDPTPIAFTASGALFALAAVEFDLFDVLPAAREAVRDHVIDDLRDGVVVVVDGHVSDLNPAAEEMLGASETLVGGRPLAAVAPELAAHLDDGERTFEFAPDDADGIYDVRVSSFSSVTGRVEGVVLTLRDVTDRRRREQRLSVMNRVLRHDLRNDLNVVSGYAALVANDETDTGDRRAAAEKVVTRVDSMIALAEKVRAVERALDGGRHPREPLDIGPTLRETVARAERSAEGATVSYRGPETVPVEATPLVGVVFDNLVENSLRHAGEDPTVELRVDVGDEVRVTVHDDGPGIPAYELDAIRGDGESPLHHASGFGLWLVRWLVDLSGGRVAFPSEESGSVAHVTLTRAPAGDADPESVADAPSNPDPDAPPRSDPPSHSDASPHPDASVADALDDEFDLDSTR